METFTQPKITGYRQLTEDEASCMNKIKEMGNAVGSLLMSIEADELEGRVRLDGRWVSIAKTQLQQGFMALTRAVARPESF